MALANKTSSPSNRRSFINLRSWCRLRLNDVGRVIASSSLNAHVIRFLNVKCSYLASSSSESMDFGEESAELQYSSSFSKSEKRTFVQSSDEPRPGVVFAI